jgi:hypothetical protein
MMSRETYGRVKTENFSHDILLCSWYLNCVFPKYQSDTSATPVSQFNKTFSSVLCFEIYCTLSYSHSGCKMFDFTDIINYNHNSYDTGHQLPLMEIWNLF